MTWLMLDALAVYLALIKQAIGVLAVLLALSGLDDLAIDLLYGLRRLWRRTIIYSRFPRATAASLSHHQPEPGWMAVLIPAWDESTVIGAMLRTTLARLAYPRYRLYVGAYPNDPLTAAAVRDIAAGDDRVRLVLTARDGPTTKADCLNALYAAVLRDEAAGHAPFKAIVLHDAEDVVHPRSLSVFDHLIPRKAMVQLPVLPLARERHNWVAGTYLDEFAESHAKDLVVREWLGASLPCAGVGCAFSRAALALAATENGGLPFRADSVTEDYELGVRLGVHGLDAALVRIPADDADTRIVATREYFPATLEAAVRQRARWLLGITLAGWQRLGWPGTLVDRYMLLRDRKALLNAYLNIAAYVAALHLAALWLTAQLWPAVPRFPALIEPGGVTALLVRFNAALLAWRLLLRALFTARLYGWREGLRAVPRAVVSNIVNFLAAVRAVRLYTRARRSRTPLAWDKTAHHYPTPDALDPAA